jgi:hypothetical protein
VHNGDGPHLLKLEGCDLKPTSKDILWPVEWWTLTINAQKVENTFYIEHILKWWTLTINARKACRDTEDVCVCERVSVCACR